MLMVQDLISPLFLVRLLKLDEFIKPDEDPIQALKDHGIPGTIDPNYKQPELDEKAQLRLDIETLKYAVSLQARYIEYVRNYLEQVIAPNFGGTAPHDMVVWVAITTAPSKEEAEKAVSGIMALRRARSSRIRLL